MYGNVIEKKELCFTPLSTWNKTEADRINWSKIQSCSCFYVSKKNLFKINMHMRDKACIFQPMNSFLPALQFSKHLNSYHILSVPYSLSGYKRSHICFRETSLFIACTCLAGTRINIFGGRNEHVLLWIFFLRLAYRILSEAWYKVISVFI